MMSTYFRPTVVRVALLVAVVLCAPLMDGCASGKRKRTRRVPLVSRDVPAIMRGTIGSQASLGGIDATLISGYGLVVGLNGTGGAILDERVAASMERLMGLNGIGKAGEFPGSHLQDPISGDGKTPRQLLRDPNVAVVLVQAAVPPGAPDGFKFDVYVRALNASSLEGGTLWTTDLRLGNAGVFGGIQTKRIAIARGDVFINPFGEPGRETAGVTMTQGRVLNGGVVEEPFQLSLVMDNSSLTRARQIVSSINSRFPEGPGDRGPTARGKDGGMILVTIPREYRDIPAEFVQILRYLTVDRSYPQEYARRYVAAIVSSPSLAKELTWCLVGLGEPAIPFLRDLYESPELQPKLAGLRAGSMLGDARAAEPLLDLVRSNTTTMLRAEAIGMIAKLAAGPRIDRALHEFLLDENLQIRIAAYEALAERAERVQISRLVRNANPQALIEPGAIENLRAQAKAWLPGDTPQRIRRRPVEGGFSLDRLPGGEPLIYITQQGQPRIVLLGDDASIRQPVMVSAWSDRLLLASDSESDPIRVYYQRADGGSAVVVNDLGSSLAEMAVFFAHKPTPEDPRPGLGMSYSEVVGALHAIYKADGTKAAFATEQDRLLAALIEASQQTVAVERAEFEGQNVEYELGQEGTLPGLDGAIGDELIVPVDIRARPTLVVPIPGRGTSNEEASGGG